jgi:LPS export ABC transporter protein LptC
MRNLQFALLIISILLSSGCEEKIRPSVLSSVDSRSLPQQESWNSVITISDSGKVAAVIRSGYLRKYAVPPITIMSESLVVHLYNSEGEKTSVITAREGKVDEGTNDLEAIGNVVVVSNDGTTLRTERLFWDNTKRLVHSPEFVRIKSPREKLQGHGFESDQYLKNYRIFRVTGEARTD